MTAKDNNSCLSLMQLVHQSSPAPPWWAQRDSMNSASPRHHHQRVFSIHLGQHGTLRAKSKLQQEREMNITMPRGGRHTEGNLPLATPPLAPSRNVA